MNAPSQANARLSRPLADLSRSLANLHLVLQGRYPEISRIALAPYDAGTDLLKTFVSSNEDHVPLLHYEALLSDVPSLLGMAARREPRVVDDIDVTFPVPTRHSEWLKSRRYRSSYTVPICQGEDLAAFLFFDAKLPHFFTRDITAFLDIFGQIIGQLYLLRVAAARSLVGAVDMATGLARLRDVETGRHIERMAAYARLIAAGVAARFDLSDEHIEYIHLFAPLHDIGKVGIPDRVLLKPGRLDAEEWRVMRGHVEIGVALADQVVRDLGLEGDLAGQVMRNIIGGHHERGDGSGYPRGALLADIPIEARIVAVADVYDALSSPRPYKEAWDDERCFVELAEEAAAGRLDPDCVAALRTTPAARDEIRERLRDPENGGRMVPGV